MPRLDAQIAPSRVDTRPAEWRYPAPAMPVRSLHVEARHGERSRLHRASFRSSARTPTAKPRPGAIAVDNEYEARVYRRGKMRRSDAPRTRSYHVETGASPNTTTAVCASPALRSGCAQATAGSQGTHTQTIVRCSAQDASFDMKSTRPSTRPGSLGVMATIRRSAPRVQKKCPLIELNSPNVQPASIHSSIAATNARFR